MELKIRKEIVNDYITCETMDLIKAKSLIIYLEHKLLDSSDSRKREKIKKYLGFIRSWANIAKVDLDLIRLNDNVLVVNKVRFTSLGCGEFNRLYCTKKSYSRMPRDLRTYLCKNYYIDVDLINSAPTILYQFALEHNIRTAALGILVTNRELFYKTLEQEYHPRKIDPKTLTIVIINQIVIKTQSKMLQRLHFEIMQIRECIWDNKSTFSGFHEGILDNKTTLREKKRKLQSFYCYSIETKSVMLLESIIEKSINSDKIKLFIGEKFKPYSYVPTFDGALIQVFGQNTTLSIEKAIDDTNEKLGTYLNFLIKPLILSGDTILDMDLLEKYEVINKCLSKVRSKTFLKFLEEERLSLFKFSKNNITEIGNRINERVEAAEKKKTVSREMHFYDIQVFQPYEIAQSRAIYKVLLEHSQSLDTLLAYFEKFETKN
jgi:hypothetical protein